MSDERLDRELGEPLRAAADVELPGSLIDRVAPIPTRRPMRSGLARRLIRARGGGWDDHRGTGRRGLDRAAPAFQQRPFPRCHGRRRRPRGGDGGQGAHCRRARSGNSGPARWRPRPAGRGGRRGHRPRPSDRPSFARVRTAGPVPGHRNARQGSTTRTGRSPSGKKTGSCLRRRIQRISRLPSRSGCPDRARSSIWVMCGSLPAARPTWSVAETLAATAYGSRWTGGRSGWLA